MKAAAPVLIFFSQAFEDNCFLGFRVCFGLQADCGKIRRRFLKIEVA
jgi:hypothetical protein